MRRIFFCHLQKTGGSSFIRRLRRHFADNEVYPNDSDGTTIERVISMRQLLERWSVRADEVKLVSGHFPLCTAELLGGGFATCTILREPVDRTLSYLRHRQRVVPAERDRPMTDMYEDKFLFDGLVHNHMVKMLSMNVDGMTHGALTPVTLGQEHLERAIARLHEIDVVGVNEHHEVFCQEVQSAFDVQLGDPVFVNLTRRRPVPDEFRARILEDNALDVALHAAATKMVESRLASTPSGGA